MTAHRDRAARFACILATILGAASLAGCGANPYADGGKKCKLACEDDTTAKSSEGPRKTQPVPLGLAFWDENVERTPVDTNGLADLLDINPFFLVEGALLRERQAAQQAAKLAGKETTDAARCHVAAFAKPAVTEGEAWRVSADYGRCVPLSALSAALNQKAGIAQNAVERWKMGQWEAAVSATLPPVGAVTEEAAALVQPASAVGWLDAFPFVPLRASQVRRDAEGVYAPLPFTFLAASMETREAWRGQERLQSVRKSRVNGAGSGAPAAVAPLVATFSDEGGTLTLSGSITSALGNVTDPRDDSDYRGRGRTGLSLEFQFVDFALRGADIALDTRLGFRSDLILDGIIFVFVNDAFAVPIGKRAFPMWALVSPEPAAACTLVRMRRDSAQSEWVYEEEVDLCRSATAQ